MEYVPPGKRSSNRIPQKPVTNEAEYVNAKLQIRQMARRLIRGEGQPGKSVEVVKSLPKYIGRLIHSSDYIVVPQDPDYSLKPYSWNAAYVANVTEGWLLNLYSYSKPKYDTRYGDGEIPYSGGSVPVDGILTAEGHVYYRFNNNKAIEGYSVYKTGWLPGIQSLGNQFTVHSQLENYLKKN